MKKLFILVIMAASLCGCRSIAPEKKAECRYPTTFEVVNMSGNLYLFDLSSDNIIPYDGDLKAGDYVSAIMNENGTPERTDDTIESIRYAGFSYIGE